MTKIFFTKNYGLNFIRINETMWQLKIAFIIIQHT